MESVVAMLDKVLMNIDSNDVVDEVRVEVKMIMNEFPLYSELGFQ